MESLKFIIEHFDVVSAIIGFLAGGIIVFIAVATP